MFGYSNFFSYLCNVKQIKQQVIMTRKVLRQKTRQLINQSSKEMREQLERAILSGAINLKKYDNNDWLLPKILLTALLEDRVSVRSPRVSDKKKQREINRNIINVFIQI